MSYPMTYIEYLYEHKHVPPDIMQDLEKVRTMSGYYDRKQFYDSLDKIFTLVQYEYGDQNCPALVISFYNKSQKEVTGLVVEEDGNKFYENMGYHLFNYILFGKEFTIPRIWLMYPWLSGEKAMEVYLQTIKEKNKIYVFDTKIHDDFYQLVKQEHYSLYCYSGLFHSDDL